MTLSRATSSAKCVAIQRLTDDSDAATPWSSRSRWAIVATVTSAAAIAGAVYLRTVLRSMPSDSDNRT
ncbi:Uncharacterised protein [Mycobacterium tuberculosis]|nr:Uncharacterised protein [Mycobacterium tuberculosis]